MGRFLDLALLIFGFQAATVWGQAQEVVNEIPDPKQSPILDVTVSTSFPAAEIFGIKLVNGKQTQAVLSFSNNEPDPVVVAFIGGALWTPDYDPQGSRIVRNLSMIQYGQQIAPGEKESIAYTFATEMHPQEMRLNLAAIVGDKENTYYTVPAFNGTVSIVEPDSSIFDPQIMFLYLFLLGCFAGTVYFFYSVWLQPYFAPKKWAGDRSRKAKGRDTVPAEPVPNADGPAVATGSMAYNEDWIPAHHIQRPEARRIKSGNPRPKSRGKAE